MGGELTTAFGQTVRRRRVAAGISQEELASRSELHRTFISMIERGQRNPTLEVIRRLAVALGTTAADLVADAERESAAR